MPPKKRSRASESEGLPNGTHEPIIDAEITQCLEMEREIVGRVELLEPDHGVTVYFLVSTKSNVKQSLWHEGYTYWTPDLSTAEMIVNDEGSDISPNDIASFVTVATVVKGIHRVYDPKFGHISYLRGWHGIKHHGTFAERLHCVRDKLGLPAQLGINLPEYEPFLSTAQLDFEGDVPLESFGKAVLFVKNHESISTQLWFLIPSVKQESRGALTWTNKKDKHYGDSKITELYTRYATEAHGIELVPTGRKDLYMSLLNIKRIVDDAQNHLAALLNALS